MPRSTIFVSIGLILALTSCGSTQAELPHVQQTHGEDEGLGSFALVFGRDEMSPLTFDAILGADEAKEALREFVDVARNPERHRHLGVRPSRGILLEGPPGTGKTMLARATATTLGFSVINVSGSDLLQASYGMGNGQYIKAIFKSARKSAPTLIFIDEIDVLAQDLAATKQLGIEMDGAVQSAEVYVIAAANDVRFLPQSLLRANRFDRVATVHLPDANIRAQLLALCTSTSAQADDVNLKELAFLTEGMSGADLKNLTNMAALRAAKRNRDAVTMQDWDEALDDATYGPVNPRQELSDKVMWRTAIHEAGHAVAAVMIPNVLTVRKCSIVARGSAAGATSFFPSESYRLSDIGYWQDRIMVALAGQAAEDVLLGTFSNGASSDIQAASRMARDAIIMYGMDEQLGAVDRSQVDHPMLTHTVSDASHAAVDAAEERLLKSQAERGRELVTSQKEAVQRVARMLMECKTLSGAQVEQLVVNEQPVACTRDINVH